MIDRTRVHLVVGLLALVAFCAQAFFLGSLRGGDAFFAGLAEVMRARWGIHPAVAFSRTCPYLGAAFVAAGVALALGRGARVRDVAPVLLLLGVGLLLAGGCKVLFARVRPGNPVWPPVGDSYPSGHVANALLCVGAALHLLPRRSSERRASRAWMGIALAGVLFVPAVAFARVFLGRHWLTDVTGGALFATAFLGLTRAARDRAELRLPLALAVIVIPGLCFIGASGPIHLPSPSSPLPGYPPSERRQAGVDVDTESSPPVRRGRLRGPQSSIRGLSLPQGSTAFD